MLLAGAVKLMAASPPLPATVLSFNQPKPVVSIIQSPLEVNDSVLVPPLSGIVSVIFESVSTGASLVFFTGKGSENCS